MTPPKKPNSLQELKKALENAEPVMVNEEGRLMSENDIQQVSFDEKRGVPPKSGSGVRVKPTRWF